MSKLQGLGETTTATATKPPEESKIHWLTWIIVGTAIYFVVLREDKKTKYSFY